MSKKTIFIASDHRGFALKARFVSWLKEKGYEPRDLGPDNEQRVDASDFAVRVAASMRADSESKGILICGSGQAMAMTANRYRHIRAALCLNSTMARLAREHNDANILVIGSEMIGEAVAFDCLETFLNTAHLGGRYAERCRILFDLGGL